MRQTIFRKKSLLFILTYMVCLQNTAAQYDERDFIRYAVKNGLSDNYVNTVQQDQAGYIWIGTDMGLNRFDGNSFKNYYQGSAALPLISSSISNLRNLGSHRLGMWGYGGFQVLQTQQFSLTPYLLPDTTSFSKYLNNVQDVREIKERKILLSTSAGIYVLDSNRNIVFRHDAYKAVANENAGKVYGHNIFSLNQYEYLIYVDEHNLGIYHSEKNTFSLVSQLDERLKYFLPPSNTAMERWVAKTQLNGQEFIFVQWLKDSIVYYDASRKKRVATLLPVHSSSVFTWESKISTITDSCFGINDGQDGFYTFTLNRETGVINFRATKNLPGHKILCLFADKEHRLWVGTSRGLLQQKLKGPTLKTFSFSVAEKDTITGGITSVYRHKNKLYLGRFSRRYGLLIVDTASMQTIKQVALFGQDNMWNEIRSIQMYHPDTLWIGTNTGILWFDTKSERYGMVTDAHHPSALQNIKVMLAPARSDGYAWICGILDGVVARYHIASRTFKIFTPQTIPALPFSKVKSIAYDAFGDVWIGGHALTRWSSKLEVFDTLIKVYGGANKYNDDILTLSADARGSLWMHNAYNDLLEYKIREKKFVPYTARDGLPIGEIRSFSPVINNLLWIGSSNNLTRFDTYTKEIKVFDHTDGLPDERPSSRNIYFDADTKEMYMPANNSIVKFPLNYAPKAEAGSDLIIQELTVNNKKSFFNSENNIRLQANENNLALSFTVIDFEAGNNYRFAYKMKESEGWVDIGNTRIVNLTSLQPGDYDIKVKALSKSGLSKIKTISFSIDPPWWKTGWFIAGLIFSVVGLGYMLYQYRIGEIKQKANLDKLLAQTEMKALHAQMNPHFIFNSLNSIREMILNNENKEASHFLGKFANLIRLTLDQSGKAFISLRNTIDYLTRYMEMEQIRNEQFTCRIYADDELEIDETFLPPMLIQPFIENSLWHGTRADDKRININIDFKKTGKQLLCIIEDNGIGIEASLQQKQQAGSQHVSVGISNIKNRIQLLNEKYNLRSLLSIEDKSNLPFFKTSGTLVTLRLPLKSGKDE